MKKFNYALLCCMAAFTIFVTGCNKDGSEENIGIYGEKGNALEITNIEGFGTDSLYLRVKNYVQGYEFVEQYFYLEDGILYCEFYDFEYDNSNNKKYT